MADAAEVGTREQVGGFIRSGPDREGSAIIGGGVIISRLTLAGRFAKPGTPMPARLTGLHLQILAVRGMIVKAPQRHRQPIGPC